MRLRNLQLVLISALVCQGALAEDEPGPLDPARLEAENVIIGDIILEKEDVFDLTNPEENNWLYRLANKFHIVTKDRVIEQQLLFEPGEAFSKRVVEETERILRRNTYFYDAWITPINREDGTVDLEVRTRDVWTLKPGFSYSRSGGEDRTLIKLEELNLFGWGQQVLVARSENEDRESNVFTFRDKNLGSSWTQLKLQYADNSDGHWNELSVIRPFYSLDARWTAGVSGTDFDIERRLYDLGEKVAEFRQEREFATIFGGRSGGLKNGWVRRYTGGVAWDNNEFSAVPDGTYAPQSRVTANSFTRISALRSSRTSSKPRKTATRSSAPRTS